MHVFFCGQVLLVNLPPEKEKAKVNIRQGAGSGSRDEILVIGNSLVRNVSNICGHVKVVSIPGGGIFDVEKALSVDLSEKIIVYIGANNVNKFKNRSEEHVNTI